jgi:hypothetical protein
MSIRLPLGLFACAILVPSLMAHEGDRKLRDKKPRFELASGCGGSSSRGKECNCARG